MIMGINWVWISQWDEEDLIDHDSWGLTYLSTVVLTNVMNFYFVSFIVYTLCIMIEAYMHFAEAKLDQRHNTNISCYIILYYVYIYHLRYTAF